MAEAEIFGVLTHPFFTNIILPFLLIFTVVFAILEKTGILGKEKKYANLIVALVIGFMFIGVQTFVGFTLRFIPMIAVLIVVLLAYLIIFGFMNVDITENQGLKVAFGIIFGLTILGALLWSAGILEKITASKPSADVLGIVILVVLIAGAISLVVSTGKKSENKGK